MLSKGMCVCLLKMRIHQMIRSREEWYSKNADICLCMCVCLQVCVSESASRRYEKYGVGSVLKVQSGKKKSSVRIFPGGPVIKTPSFHCLEDSGHWGHRLNPWLEN